MGRSDWPHSTLAFRLVLGLPCPSFLQAFDVYWANWEAFANRLTNRQASSGLRHFSFTVIEFFEKLVFFGFLGVGFSLVLFLPFMFSGLVF